MRALRWWFGLPLIVSCSSHTPLADDETRPWPFGGAESEAGSRSVFDALASLRLDVQALGASSASPRLDNKDHGHYLSQGDPERVLFDSQGPGVIHRFWHTGKNDFVYRFYFDGEPSARFSADGRLLWRAEVDPFVSPLLLPRDVSSGGAVSYYPIAFERSLRITARSTSSRGLDYYNIAYSRQHGAATSGADALETARRMMQGGESLYAPRDGDASVTGTVTVEPGSSQLLAELIGPAQIVALELESPSADGDDADVTQPILAALSTARIQIVWDDDEQAAVDAPLNDFFASSASALSQLQSLPIGNADGRFYCHFPMPFGRRARVSIENRDGEGELGELSYRLVSRSLDDDPAGLGRFHAQFRSSDATELDRDYEILRAHGSGHYVGVTMLLPQNGDTLEGNERIYVDGARSPAIAGTGTEDYFGAGWYFEHGSFSTPLHGARLGPSDEDPVVAYRFHLTDLVPFRRSIRVSIQHGALNDNTLPYRSVAYYYSDPRDRLLETDRLYTSVESSVDDHGYLAPGAQLVQATSRFNDDDPRDHAYRGTSLAGSSEFLLASAADNEGAILRRLSHAPGARQEADVFVDGQEIGTWQDLSRGVPERAWREEDYFIPARYTRGKERLKFRIRKRSSQWTEVAYQLLVLTPARDAATGCDACAQR